MPKFQRRPSRILQSPGRRLRDAAINGNGKIASLLLNSGADVTAEDFSDPPETVAVKADLNREKDIVELLKGQRET